jgi:hypothetical protein
MDASSCDGSTRHFRRAHHRDAGTGEERADVTRMNKGRESMEAALEMIQLLAPPPRSPRAPRRPR